MELSMQSRQHSAWHTVEMQLMFIIIMIIIISTPICNAPFIREVFLLSTYHVPGTVLDCGSTAVEVSHTAPALCELVSEDECTVRVCLSSICSLFCHVAPTNAFKSGRGNDCLTGTDRKLRVRGLS